MKAFLDVHGLKLNDWDVREDQRGHVILKWAEPGLRIGAVVVVSDANYTVDIARDISTCNRWSRRQQRVQATNEYEIASHDLIAIVGEIRRFREQLRSA